MWKVAEGERQTAATFQCESITVKTIHPELQAATTLHGGGRGGGCCLMCIFGGSWWRRGFLTGFLRAVGGDGDGQLCDAAHIAGARHKWHMVKNALWSAPAGWCCFLVAPEAMVIVLPFWIIKFNWFAVNFCRLLMTQPIFVHTAPNKVGQRPTYKTQQ